MRRRYNEEDKRTVAQLQELQRKLMAMPLHEVEREYAMRYRWCEYKGFYVPCPATIQEFVTTWKVLRTKKPFYNISR
jgi:hypothetical protein